MATSLETIVRYGKEGLDALFAESRTPDWEALEDSEFKGYNIRAGLNLSVLTVFLHKFKKGFYKDGIACMGYNIPVRQNKFSEPWICKPSDERPKRFGYFRVDNVDPKSIDNLHPHALLLDYGRGGKNSPPLRDYLVQVSDDVFLGFAYLALGPLRIPMSYFALERDR